MINIVLPIAGKGSRFLNAGYTLPKPLIPIHGKPMIEVVVNNVRPKTAHNFIFIALKEHLEHLGMRETLLNIAPGCSIISVDCVTEGAACTVLLATELINNENQLMLVNSDQWVDIDINDYLEKIKLKSLDGLIMTMTANDSKWSYVGLDSNSLVNKVVEKQVISSEATVGIYNFRRGSDFVFAANKMIQKELRVNGEFFVAPVYNELISENFKISFYNIGSEGDGMYGLGIPSDLDLFLNLPISKKL